MEELFETVSVVYVVYWMSAILSKSPHSLIRSLSSFRMRWDFHVLKTRDRMMRTVILTLSRTSTPRKPSGEKRPLVVW